MKRYITTELAIIPRYSFLKISIYAVFQKVIIHVATTGTCRAQMVRTKVRV